MDARAERIRAKPRRDPPLDMWSNRSSSSPRRHPDAGDLLSLCLYRDRGQAVNCSYGRGGCRPTARKINCGMMKGSQR